MYTITVTMSVAASSRTHALAAQHTLAELLDGTDFMNVQVVDAETDYYHEDDNAIENEK